MEVNMKQRHIKTALVVVFLFLLSLGLEAGTWDFILPLSKPTAICQDDSVYWIGTEKGLIRLDTITGDTEQFYNLTSSLPSHYITGIVRGRDDRIWVGTDAGLAVYDGGRMVLCDQSMLKTDFANHPVSSMIVDGEGLVWVCFSEELENVHHTVVIGLEPNGLRSYEYETDYDFIGYSPKGICAYYIDPPECGYGVYESILMLLDSKKNKPLRRPLREFSSPSALDKNGDVLFLAESLHIVRNLSAESDSVTISPLDHPGSIVNSISSDPFNNVFAIIDGIAYIWNGIKWKNLNIPPEFMEHGITLTGTADGKIVAVNQSQLLEMSDTLTRTFIINPALIGSEDNSISRDIDRDRTGKVWFATNTALVSFDGSTWRQILYESSPDPDGEKKVALELDSMDKIWLSFDDKLYTVEGDGLVFQKSVYGLIDMAIDSEDRLWIMCHDQLLCHHNGVWQRFFNSDCGLQNIDIIDFYIDSRDRLWAHSRNGNNPEHKYKIYRFNGIEWLSYFYDVDVRLNGVGATDIFMDTKDRLWVGGVDYDGVILCYQNGTITQYTSDTCFCVDFVEDLDGTWWAWGNTKGIGQDQVLHFDGKDVISFPHNFFPAIERQIFIDNDGNKWFVTETETYNEQGVNLWHK